MIDIRKLKELVKLMVNNDLAEIDLRDPDEQVTLRRHGEPVVMPQVSTPATPLLRLYQQQMFRLWQLLLNQTAKKFSAQW